MGGKPQRRRPQRRPERTVRGKPPPRQKTDRDIARESAPPPTDAVGTRRTGEGTVLWWRDDRGYGAIDVKKVAPWDVWCHFSAIQVRGHRTLKPGQRVEVDYIRTDQDSFKYRAETVRLLADPEV
jgi:CspA family cold shock protein